MDIFEVLEYTASVTVIGLLIWGVKLIFHDKLDARWHYFIWLVLLVRMIVPIHIRSISTPLSVFQELPIGKWMDMGRILVGEMGYTDLFDILGRGYLWGAVLLGAFYLAMWTILRLQVALAPRADESVREYVDGVAGKYGVKSCGDIRVRRSGTPYICGLVHPVLVLPLPGGLARNACSDAIDAKKRLPGEQVILHELLHKRHRDVLVNIVIHGVRVVNWFNPLVWFLTAVVLNDSEALCDQRVLEHCGAESAREYGALLVAMGEGRKNPIRVGTSNMASSYRNMKSRIRRIRDFKRVPGKIGVVALCITLMLAVAGIDSGAREAYGIEIPEIDSERALEWALLNARCYPARTPEEAIYLFLRACEEKSTVYRMAVMPEAEISRYEVFTRKWFHRRDITTWAELSAGEEEGFPAYFPKEAGFIGDYQVFNLTHDGSQGSAVVCGRLDGTGENAFVEWRLALQKEDGWKVWLEEESKLLSGRYSPKPLLAGSVRLGDFLVELSGYNEGSFDGLGTARGWGFLPLDREEAPEGYPEYFSIEYKYSYVYVTYLGEESLAGHTVRVVSADAAGIPEEDGSVDGESGVMGRDGEKPWEMAGSKPPGTGLEDVDFTGYSYSSSNGDGDWAFDGAELMDGEPRMAYGVGNGFVQPGYCWKESDRTCKYIRIYIDGNLAADGEVWAWGA